MLGLIFKFYYKNDLWTTTTCQQRPLVNNDHYFWVPKVVVVQMFFVHSWCANVPLKYFIYIKTIINTISHIFCWHSKTKMRKGNKSQTIIFEWAYCVFLELICDSHVCWYSIRNIWRSLFCMINMKLFEIGVFFLSKGCWCTCHICFYFATQGFL